MITNRQLFLSHLAQTTSFPLMLEIERAEGMYLYGENGEKIMDLISGIGGQQYWASASKGHKSD